MKHLKKYIALICALCLMLGVFSGCGDSADTEPEVYDTANEMVNLESGVIAENEFFSLSWNQERAAVSVTSKKDGTVWSTTPYQYLNSTTMENVLTDQAINSSVTVTCRNAEQTFEYYASTSCVATGRFSSAQRENGLTVTYYFDEIESIVAVDFYLEEDGFKVSVDPGKIKCYSENHIIGVTPAPFLCSVANTALGDKNSYLAIPSGSGALMYTDIRSDGSVRTFSGNVYGNDYTIEAYEQASNETPLTMPFFGIKAGTAALCAIIEQAAESCAISARTGDELMGYSYVNASYQVIGYNRVFAAGTHRTQYNEAPEANLNPLVIGYYPLTGDQANYAGMAKRYKQYLTEKEKMQKSQDNTLLTVKLIGSFVKDDLILGLPYGKKTALTTYQQAEEILNELNTVAGGSLIADMYAYGEGGLNASKLAGNYTLTGVVGGKKALNQFIDFTKNASIKTFFNFDPVVFYESGGGFSTNTDSATNVNGVVAPVRQFWYSTRARYDRAEGGVVGTMVARDQLGKSVSKTVSLADRYGITGLAYTNLGSMAYSDYSEVDGLAAYPLKNNMGADVEAMIAETKSNSKTVMIDGGFAYAAAAADIITGCPTISNQNNAFDLDVPLYQIVFQGTKSNSVSPINCAANSRTQFLKAIETGSGLSFTLMGSYDNELRKQYDRHLNTTLYSDNKAMIESYVNESKAYLASVAGATIASHSYVTAEVVKTVFDNGVTVYVNYGDKDYQSDIGTVKAQGFLTR